MFPVTISTYSKSISIFCIDCPQKRKIKHYTKANKTLKSLCFRGQLSIKRYEKHDYKVAALVYLEQVQRFWRFI